jgi:hypothetical protein
MVAGDPHDRLRDRERDDLRVGQTPSVVDGLLRQEIISDAEHVDQQQVEVGVHRGPQGRRLALQSTADFDLPAYVPFNTTTPPPVVELLI